MVAAKPKKPRDGSRTKRGKSIPMGDTFLPGVDTDVLWEMYAKLSGRKDMRKEALLIAAAIKRREGLSVSEIARQLLQPRSTVSDWLARLRDRGLEGISDRTTPTTGRYWATSTGLSSACGCPMHRRRTALSRAC
ncbi:MAG: MarR family transcriptional regulator, partial [Nitrosopumilaceae archaeon]|nr:MarR family transcriptional regulator [Nitrosopumilaceae archaeon]